LSLKPTWYGIMGMIVTQTRNPFFLVLIYDKNFFNMFKLFVAKTWPNFFRSNKKDQSTVHESARAGRMTKTRPDLIFCYNTIFSIVIQWKFRMIATHDREREFFYLLFIIFYLFIIVSVNFVLVYVRNIHGDGTVRYAHDHANETFTVVVL